MKLSLESRGIKWEAEFDEENIDDIIEYFGFGLMSLTYCPELIRKKLNLEETG